MTPLHHGGQGGVLALLLAYLALMSVIQIWMGHQRIIGWSGFSLLAPLVAGALLPLRHTVAVGALTLVAIDFTYGFGIPEIPAATRLVVIVAALCSAALGVALCRHRLGREARVRRLTIARERLTLLRVASRHIGSTLDVDRTAHEVADIAVPGFADLVTVDLYEQVVRGEEPTEPGTGGFALRRVARRSVGDDDSDAAGGLTSVHDAGAEPARFLSRGRAARARLLGPEDMAGWLGETAERAHGTGLPSGIAVPLRARGTTLGLAVFIRHVRADPFDSDDLLLAEEIGAQAAVCVDNARRFTHEHRASLALQQSLLPRRLPDIAAVEVATRYLPADSTAGVGGDWFDVIKLSGARVALVVGDVVGHGMHASATMGRLRSAVRTLADIDLAPDELLTHLDDVVLRLGSETEQTEQADGDGSGSVLGATCLYAVYDPVSRACTFARAGHPAPAMVGPDGRVEFVDAAAGPPLGLGGLPFEATELTLPEDSLLVLYTNGLVAAGRDMERGLADLRRVLTRPAHSVEVVCDTVLKTMLDGGPTDDIALLIARTRALDARHVATWGISDDPTAVAHARDLAGRQLSAWGVPEAAFTTELVVSELVTNAIRHAGGPIQLRLIREPAALICEVSDQSSTSPHLRRARVLDESGRGLFIVSQLTERWGTRHGRIGKTIWAELSPSPALAPSG
ncbi:ATP-binding SpoIIE family protein phosphatase [Streptomyces litchfieldiae]|uniref:SpoIIE family protein phosphatase n=1 Tax=Streptomyces litchfieldiae TaxID=3075543 RepID=A0ABU2MLY5_9ACTN|nr:SpoIIE family protein phosphatase [Streptomyces sp. DSM 44938]MDT0342621.1 SpoIIE family protein phosphatase [Streptomyces sp. DSM 44938]